MEMIVIWEFIHFIVGKNKHKTPILFGLDSVFFQSDFLIDVLICMQHCISTRVL
jgi:hypothetical protein